MSAKIYTLHKKALGVIVFIIFAFIGAMELVKFLIQNIAQVLFFCGAVLVVWAVRYPKK